MPGSRRASGSTSAALVVLGLVTGCAFAGTSSPTSPSCSADEAPAPTTTARATGSEGGDLVIVGRIVTMDDPPIAEALLIEAGFLTCVGTRDEVMAVAGEEVQVVDIGSNVAYPGFIDAHAHWIGDREYYGLDTAAEAMDAALSRGWTSISEQWVNPERLDELADPGRRPRPADSGRRLPRPELRRRVLRRLVHRARAGAGGAPPARPGAEDPSRRRSGRGHQLGAARPDRDHRPGRRGGLAGLGPQREHGGSGAWSSTRSSRRSERAGRTRCTTVSSTPSR